MMMLEKGEQAWALSPVYECPPATFCKESPLTCTRHTWHMEDSLHSKTGTKQGQLPNGSRMKITPLLTETGPIRRQTANVQAEVSRTEASDSWRRKFLSTGHSMNHLYSTIPTLEKSSQWHSPLEWEKAVKTTLQYTDQKEDKALKLVLISYTGASPVRKLGTQYCCTT